MCKCKPDPFHQSLTGLFRDFQLRIKHIKGMHVCRIHIRLRFHARRFQVRHIPYQMPEENHEASDR